MFRSRRSLYYGKGKRRQNISLLWIVLSLPLLLLVLEILTRIVVGVFGHNKELAIYQGEPADVTAFRLKFVTRTGKTYDGLSERGGLKAERSLGVSYQLASNQKNQFWQINAQGFRDNENLPVTKPKDEIRIFVLGGSTAFGQGSKGNEQTIAHKLEQRLQARVSQQKTSPEKYRPDIFPFFKPLREDELEKAPKIKEGTYRVINAAVPGYTSGNQLAQLALQILPYQPDLIVVLDGYDDLMLPSTARETDIPNLDQLAHNAPHHLVAYLSHSLQGLLLNTYVVKATQYFILKPKPTVEQTSLAVKIDNKSLEEHLPENQKELEQRMQRYRDYHQQMVRLCTAAGIPLILAVQPEITGVSPLSPQEAKIVTELGHNYQEKMKTYYPELVKTNKQIEKNFPQNVKVVNFYNLDNRVADATFIDAIHVNNTANTVIAEQLYNMITSLPKVQIIPKNL